MVSRTLFVAMGIIGLKRMEMFLICSHIVNKIVFILFGSLFLKDQGSESLKYLLALKEKPITSFKYSFKFCLFINSISFGIFILILFKISLSSLVILAGFGILLLQFFLIKEKTLWHKFP